jgi:Zn ribbon nucleic-acid-binding protein
MGILRITKKADLVKRKISECPRCYGCLVNEWESEIEDNLQRCVLCGYRHEPKTKTSLNFETKLNRHDRKPTTSLNFEISLKGETPPLSINS